MLSFLIGGCSIYKLPVEVANFVQSKGNVITSIDPQHTDFKDLESIGNAIGNRRLVLLGEATHGDGKTFLAKSRLIKYLHEQKGFDVLAFEADFIALNQLSLSYIGLRDSLESTTGLAAGINPIWSATEECHELLFNYIPQTYRSTNPLHVVGIDPQPYGLALGKRDSLNKLLKHLGSMAPLSLVEDIDTLISCSLKPANELATLDTALASRLNRLDGNIRQLLTAARDKSGLMFQTLQNLKYFCQEVLHFSNEAHYSFRDSCMAENVKWLIDKKFAGKKIIVWSANSHIGKQPTNFRLPFTPMGKYLVDHYGEKAVYSLAVTARSGTSGVFGPTQEIESQKEGFENAVPENSDYAFFDFSQSSDAQEPSFFMNALGGRGVKLPWKQHFDGIFYINEMAPSTKLVK